MSRTAVTARLVLASVVALLPIAGIAVAALVLGPELPGRMASHWSGPGPADGFSSTWGSFWTFGAISGAFAIAVVVTAVLAARQEVPRTFPAIVALVAGFTACAWIVPAWATADAATPADARLGARMLVMIAAVASGAAIYLLLPPTAPPSSDDAVRPTLPVSADERISWTGATGSRILEVVAALSGLVFVVILATALMLRQSGLWTPVVILGLATVLVSAFAHVRLTVDRRGIRLVSLLLRVPLIVVRLDNIESVTADIIEPRQWGGWGLRISGAGLAYVARRGPGLIIDRRGGNAVAITIDGAEKPAAVANALISRLAASRTSR